MIEGLNGHPMFATAPLPVQADVATSDDRVRAYILAHNLEGAVNKTVSLAKSLLPGGSETLLSLSNDGESAETWLVVHLLVNSTGMPLFQVYERFVDAWVDSIPSAAQHRIHLTYASRNR